MRPYSRWIFLAIVFIQVAWLGKDARDWCLWLPGLTLCAVGLLADRRTHLSGNALFWIVCLVLYVIAPASQLEGDAFQGPISVVGIHFSDAVIVRTVALADLFMGSVLVMQLFLARSAAHRERAGGPAEPSPAHQAIDPPLATHAPSDPAQASAPGRDDDDPAAGRDDGQVYVLVDDPGEFRHLRDIDEVKPEPEPPIREEERLRPERGTRGDSVSGILHSPGLALVMLMFSIAVPAATYLMVGSLDFVTNGRNFALSAFSDSAWGILINSFVQDLLVILCLLGIERYRARRTTGNLILVAVVAVFMLMMVNPLNTARYQVGAVLIMACLFCCRGRFPMALSYAGIALYMYAVMPAMNLLRYGLTGMQGQRIGLGIDYNTLDYDCFSMFAFAVYRTGIDDFAYGRYLCSSVLFFLPRSWWPDKPKASSLDLGQYLMQHHSGWFDNLSCPPMGDGYMDFGVAGVLCMGLLFGFLIECSDRVIDRWSQATFIRRGLAVAFVAFLPILLRGSLGAVMGFVVAPLVLLLILGMAARTCQWMSRTDRSYGLAWKMRSLPLIARR